MWAACLMAAVLVVLPLGPLAVMGWIVTLPFSFVACGIVGLPLYFAARRVGRVNSLTAATAGAVTGASVPLSFMLLAGELWAWESIVILGVGGAGMGLWFLVLLNWPADPFLRSRRLAGAIAAVGMAYLLFWMSLDHSCHNPMRGRFEGIASVAHFSFEPGRADWAGMTAEAEGFAKARGWSIQRDSGGASPYDWRKISVCREAGTLFALTGAEDGIEVAVYQPQGGGDWVPPLRAFHAQLAQRWPGAITYRDGLGQKTHTPPAWAAAPSPTPAPSSTAR